MNHHDEPDDTLAVLAEIEAFLNAHGEDRTPPPGLEAFLERHVLDGDEPSWDLVLLRQSQRRAPRAERRALDREAARAIAGGWTKGLFWLEARARRVKAMSMTDEDLTEELEYRIRAHWSDDPRRAIGLIHQLPGARARAVLPDKPGALRAAFLLRPDLAARALPEDVPHLRSLIGPGWRDRNGPRVKAAVQHALSAGTLTASTRSES